MEVKDTPLTQSIEYVDAICLDKSIIINDGTTTATITTVDGQSLPVTFIVSQPLDENAACDESAEDVCDVSSDGMNVSLKLEDKDDPRAVYTVHFPNKIKQEDSSYLVEQEEDVQSEQKPALISDCLVDDILEIPPEMDSTPSIGRLEDFMDVVTTYKCKFCRFSCPWKSGLMSHIRCCHIKEKTALVTLKAEKKAKSASPVKSTTPTVPSKNDQPATESVPVENGEPTKETPEVNSKEDSSAVNGNSKLITDDEASTSSSDSPVLERHIFLCGQCSDGFVSLEECKQHMINDHNLKLSPDSVKAVRKRGRPRTRPPKEEKAPAKKRVKKEAPPKETKKRRTLYMNLEDELDCCIRRKLRTGYVNDRAFRCTERGCGHRFTSDSNLKYHLSSHSDNEKLFTCQECREEFSNWRALAMHLWRDHTIDIDLYSCTECSYKAFSFFKVDNHRKIHSDERPYMCETCGKSFKQISQLRNHVVIHLDRRNLPEKRWYSEQECQTCGRKFSDTKCLRKHEQAVHSKLKPYVCTFCGHLSARKAMLELHMRQHTGEKPFLCEHCDYRTGDHNSLRRHRMRHTGDKTYKCPHCPYACIQAISFKTHLRNKHPGMDGLYSCTMCTFKTVSKDNFLHHVADHKRQTAGNLEDATANIPPAEPEITLETNLSDQSAVQMQLTDNALQQLEGILPGNLTAAQLIYSCLNAMSQEGGSVSLPPGVTLNIPQSTTSSEDGTQTITIQVPSSQDMESEPYYFTIQQQDGTTALLVPSTDLITEDIPEGTDVETVQLTEQDISCAAASLECGVLPEEDDGTQLQQENSDLVIAHIESLTDPETYNEIMAVSDIQQE